MDESIWLILFLVVALMIVVGIVAWRRQAARSRAELEQLLHEAEKIRHEAEVLRNEGRSRFVEFNESWIMMDIREIWMLAGVYPINQVDHELVSHYRLDTTKWLNESVKNLGLLGANPKTALGKSYKQSEKEVYYHVKRYYPQADIMIFRLESLPANPIGFVKHTQLSQGFDLTLNPGVKSRRHETFVDGIRVEWGFYFVRTK